MVLPIEGGENTRENEASKLQNTTEEGKDDLFTFLQCPFPEHRGYAELWAKLSPKGQRQMKENIRISADGKIEMIKMKKKFSVLKAEHNGEDIFKGEHEDRSGKTGIKGVTYLTGLAAERVCKEQNKKLLNDEAEVEQFIDLFPGESHHEKIFNFVNLFGLEKVGYWDRDHKKWDCVGIASTVLLSRLVGGEDTTFSGKTYGVVCKDKRDAGMSREGPRGFPSPFVACEPAP